MVIAGIDAHALLFVHDFDRQSDITRMRQFMSFTASLHTCAQSDPHVKSYTGWVQPHRRSSAAHCTDKAVAHVLTNVASRLMKLEILHEMEVLNKSDHRPIWAVIQTGMNSEEGAAVHRQQDSNESKLKFSQLDSTDRITRGLILSLPRTWKMHSMKCATLTSSNDELQQTIKT